MPPAQHLVKDGKGGYTIENIRRPGKTLLVNQIRKDGDEWRIIIIKHQKEIGYI
ncbi:MAG: hypothetical protein HUU08_05715 [Candidatus Brocadia sp.]|nr:hypothetical protein [Candidatus Brocadia sp.]